MNDKINKIEAQIKELQLKKQKLKSQEIKQERKDETRRKIILGAFLLHMLEKDENLYKLTKDNLSKFILNGKKSEKSKEKDLELFKDIL